MFIKKKEILKQPELSNIEQQLQQNLTIKKVEKLKYNSKNVLGKEVVRTNNFSPSLYVYELESWSINMPYHVGEDISILMKKAQELMYEYEQSQIPKGFAAEDCICYELCDWKFLNADGLILRTDIHKHYYFILVKYAIILPNNQEILTKCRLEGEQNE